MNVLHKIAVGATATLVMLAMIAFTPAAYAATPTLSLATTGDGDTVQLTVSGDASSNVILYYTKTGSGPQLAFLGYTDASGAFTANVSTATYDITADTPVHVLVNGQASTDVSWPYTSATGLLTLSSTSVMMTVGDQTILTAYNAGGTLYLSSNSNPPVVNTSISGNQLTITALNFGSTILTFCAQGNTTRCASTYVNVQNTDTQPLAFSQSTLTIASSQTVPISVYGGTGSYVVLNNSNASLISTSISGDTVNLTANGSSGFAAVTICSSDMSACGIVNANISTASSVGLTLSPTTVTLSSSQTATINISGGTSGTYSIYNNSDTNVISASLSGNSLTLTPEGSGTATVVVCSTNGSCGAVDATVISSTTSSGELALSQNNLWLQTGQSFNITVSGGTTPYSVLNTSNIVTTSLDNNILTITAVNTGSATVNVCSAKGACVPLSILINGTNTNTNATALTFSQSNMGLTVGNTGTIALYGTGGYYVSVNTDQNVATASMNGSNVIISALNPGNAKISVCQSNGQCGILNITVAAATNTNTNTNTDNNNEKTTTPPASTVNYADNTLLRDSEHHIYVILNNTKKAITSLAQLQANYAGLPIQDVSDDTINQIANYSASSAVTPPATTTTYADNTLLRDSEHHIYVITGNKKNLITSLYELQHSYAGLPIQDVSDDTINQIAYAAGSAVVATPTSNNYKFTTQLTYGMSGNDVLELQKRLTAEGVYSGPITGNFLSLTLAGVKAYQAKYGIQQTGNVGPLTMAQLDK